MPKIPIPVAAAGALMGAAAIPPVLLDAMERGELTSISIGFALMGCAMVVCGLAALIVGIRASHVTSMPSGARLVIVANVLFLAFFTLEFSDLMVRQNGKIIYWTNFLFLPTLILFRGLLTAQRWAWWMARGLAASGVLWFLVFTLLIPFGNIERNGVPASWDARVYMICVSLAFAWILAGAFWAIGRSDTRNYFGLITDE